MRKKIFLTSFLAFLLISLILLSISNNSTGTQKEYIPQQEYVPNEVLVKFKKDTKKDFIQGAIQSVQGKIISYIGEEIIPFQWEPDNLSLRSFRLDPYLFHLKVPETIGTSQAIYILSQYPGVEYAEENAIGHFFETIPNDDYFDLQWALKNNQDKDIDATDAWDIFNGSSQIVVAVIDTGVDYSHKDLQANIWVNEDEIPGNGKDDDNNGYIDDVHGYDFYEKDPYPFGSDDHGTHVAGIIGAVGNNDEGIAGVNWNVKIMVLRNGTKDKWITSATIQSIDYAIENDAHLSNNSYGTTQYNSPLYWAIHRAMYWEYGSGGKLFVAAAGNTDQFPDPDNDRTPIYPASYNLDNIISVCATDSNDNLAYFSHYGRNTVDIGAPGWSILSTIRYGYYDYKSGTSMSAPHVAGLAALIWGKCPLLKWQTAKNRLMNKVDHLTSLENKTVSEGRINAYKAIYDPSPPISPSNLNGASTAWTMINIWWQDNSSDEAGFEIQRKKSSENDFLTIGSQRDNVASYSDKTAIGGITHYYKVRAFNFAGNSSFSNTVSVIVPANPPDAPSNLEALYGALEVQLRWHDNSNNEQYFIIERKSNSEPWWEEIGTAGPNETYYYDNTVQCYETYYYRVRAYNPYGYSGYSNTVSIEIICY
jgi:hypothetical protein